MSRLRLLVAVVWWGGWTATVMAQAEPPLRPIVTVAEEVYRYEPANNGAGPLWCRGSTCLVRLGDRVVASGLETLTGVPPLNNCRWTLFDRNADGWHLRQRDATGRTREPCPLAVSHAGQLFLSVNPTLAAPDAYGGPAQPQLLRWSVSQLDAAPETILPSWNGTPAFTEHSYRTLAADGAAGELLIMQNIDYTHAEWAFRDATGRWSAQGRLVWPWGAEYDHPQPIRVCYPTVMLRQRAVHFCGVSDIQEPYDAWRAYKRELTGRDWDYDFRRLFYTWTDDITSQEFQPWVEIASRDQTCGWVTPCDLYQADDGRVHLLWTEQALDTRLREKFFPEARQSYALNYAVLERGVKIAQQSLVLAEEGGANEIVSAARFHVAPHGRLVVVCYVSGTDAAGQRVSENRILELSEGALVASHRVALVPPMTSFFTATVRGGSPPSPLLDLLGTRAGAEQAISYVCLRLYE
ncbi:MAG: hypothetical protein MUF48_02725 [Pirellulaceae bacterium]|jgi:hypothetical protein|nr:hypothetical protein [Pirellulaceae bacterium]